MTEGYAPIQGKCLYWREHPNDDDLFDYRVKKEDKRVDCSCFIEGQGWQATASTVPRDCPNALHCRYYIKHM